MSCCVRLYRDGALELDEFPLGQVSDFLAEPDTVVWIDLCGPHGGDLKQVAEELGLHALAVEDAISEQQRPKLDRYSSHLYLAVYEIELDRDSDELRSSELGAFVTDRALVTIRKDDGFRMEAVTRRWDDNRDLAKSGVGFLLWGLLDHVVDGYFAVMQQLDEDVDGLEDMLFDEQSHELDMQRRSFRMRKSLVAVRRVVLPMREVVNALLRRDLGVVDEPMQPYYQDVYDHVMRATEWTESLRDLATTILETHLTVQGNRLNEIMKKLTAYAALVAVPTAVTGFFGQNVPYPGFGHQSGYIASVLITIAIVTFLYTTLHHRHWL